MSRQITDLLKALPAPSERRIAIHVHSDAERTLRFGHPWLYQEAIRKQSREGAPGDLAVIYDHRERFLAIGLYDPASPIRVRVLQRHAPAPIDASWFSAKIAAAVARRASLAKDPNTTGYRLVHGENDGLPGLVLDRYEDTLVLKLYTAAWVPHLREVLAVLRTAQAERVVLRLSRAVLQRIPSGHLHGLTDGATLAGKPPRGPVGFRERGMRFEADVLRGQKTGFFLDQRENRAEVERLSRGKTVLDVFACTGSFSVAAARGGAREVTSVEMSRPALEAATRHMALNHGHPAASKARHHVIAGDAFEVLHELGSGGTRYDCVILDPPSFANAKRDVNTALCAYARLVRLGLGVLSPGGVLVISSCSGQVDAETFFATVHRTARSAGRLLRELARTGQPLDHPVTFPEGAYLKCLFADARETKTPLPRSAREGRSGSFRHKQARTIRA